MKKPFLYDTDGDKPRIHHLLFFQLFLGLEDQRISRIQFIGFFLGLLPGAGPVIASFASYGVEKRVSKHPERFGTGAIEGVAGPESANNSATAGAFIPLFILGIPANAVMAILLGALMIHGVIPGPLLHKQHPDVFLGDDHVHVHRECYAPRFEPPFGWALGADAPHPYGILAPIIVLFTTIGVYSTQNQSSTSIRCCSSLLLAT
jgi:putative tricarboxylic transport membrane protein